MQSYLLNQTESPMKKQLLIAFLFLAMYPSFGQQFLLFEFMKVEDKDILNYLALEDFWSKIHHEEIKDGAITGWDLWALQPGGQDQGYQYLAVTVYDDLNKMMNGSAIEQILARAKRAYPEMTENDIAKKIETGAASRSRAQVLFLEPVVQTQNTFDMPLGTVAQMALMKTANSIEYEKAEEEVFMPLHEMVVNDGLKGSWSVARVILPAGSESPASHLVFNMFKDMKQYVSSLSMDVSKYIKDWDAVNKGVATRDQKWVYLATLARKLR
jgi:hypothetical protein